MFKKAICSIPFLFVSVCVQLYAIDLKLEQADLAVIQDPKEAGYHFYIRKKADIASILITETSKDSNKRADNFAYRSPEYNSINGDEKRILDGKELEASAKKLYSLIDSTPEEHTPVGKAFHVWVPYIIVYGYEWSRNGEVQVLDGTFFNIRTFEKPYADYSGAFYDNPFVLKVTQETVDTADASVFNELAVAAFTELAELSNTPVRYAKLGDDLMPAIEDSLKPQGNKRLDLLFVLDATESMKDDIHIIRERLPDLLKKQLASYDTYRIGLVLYKDYNDEFVIKRACPFTQDIKQFYKALSNFKVAGGKDIPEAVYEGLEAGLRFDWRKEEAVDKRLILIGDAPPHPRPRGAISKEQVLKLAAQKKVAFFPIILPHKPAY